MKPVPRARLLPIAALAALLAAPAAVRAQQKPLYFSTYGGSGNIDRINPDGSVSAVQTIRSGDILDGLAFDGANLFVADKTANEVYKLNTATNAVTPFAALLPSTNAKEMVLGPDGNLYLADYNNSQIEKITTAGAAGTVSVFKALPAGSNPNGLAFDTGGNLFVANSFANASSAGNNVSRIDAATGSVTLFASLPDGTNPAGLAFDRSGSLYVAGFNTNQVLKFSADGTAATPFVTLSPTDSNAASRGQQPFGILFGPDGSLDIGESDRVGVYSASGVFMSSSLTNDGINFFAYVPEPATWLGAALLGGLAAWGTARRLRRA